MIITLKKMILQNRRDCRPGKRKLTSRNLEEKGTVRRPRNDRNECEVTEKRFNRERTERTAKESGRSFSSNEV